MSRLVNALTHAYATFSDDGRSPHARDSALGEALASLGSIERSFDAETLRPLETLYDMCLRAVGAAYGGELDGLRVALALVRSIDQRSNQTPSHTEMPM